MEITVVIINFNTPDLLQIAVESLKRYYPKIRLLIVDNGSAVDSIALIKELEHKQENTKALLLKNNMYHGPAMNLAVMEYVTTDKVFFLDSDTETIKAGFLEEMAQLIDNDQVIYGVGEFNTVNKRGFTDSKGEIILQTPYMLLKTSIYKKLPAFEHHGQPTLVNFSTSWAKGYRLIEFPVSNYINHKWRGTAERFGYGLGWRAKLDYLLNKVGL